MIPIRIELENWMPFAGVFTLDLPRGPIAVMARDVENPRRSNWIGKSAFLEAFDWILYGDHRKRYDDDLIYRGEELTRGLIIFDEDFQIEKLRKRGSSTQLTVTHGGEVLKQGAAAQRILDVIGLDAVDWKATSRFMQGETTALVSKPSGERRSVVAQWLDLDPWLRVAARARSHAAEITSEHVRVMTELEVMERKIGELDEGALAADIGGSAGEVFAAREMLASLSERLEAIALSEIVAQDESRLARLTVRWKELRSDLTGAGVSDEEMSEAQAAVSTAATAEEAAREAEEAARALTRGEFDGRCPVTCTECPVADAVASNVDAARARLREATAARVAAEKVRKERRERLTVLQGTVRVARKLRDEYEQVVREGKQLRESLKDAPKVDVDPNEAETLRKRVSELQAAERAAVSDLYSAVAEANHAEVMRFDLGKLRESVTRDDAEIRRAYLAVKATGPNGIPALIAESSLTDLEERANGILSGTGLSFTFGWERATKKLAPSCERCGYAYKGQRDKACPACSEERQPKRSDELEILVNDGRGDVEDVRAKSGGAQVLVGSAIRLAAGLMLRDRRGSRATFALVDEPFGTLDIENREQLARTFAGMLSAVGLDQALIVSHDATVLDSLPNRIEIIGHGDRSTIEVIK